MTTYLIEIDEEQRDLLQRAINSYHTGPGQAGLASSLAVGLQKSALIVNTTMWPTSSKNTNYLSEQRSR